MKGQGCWREVECLALEFGVSVQFQGRPSGGPNSTKSMRLEERLCFGAFCLEMLGLLLFANYFFARAWLTMSLSYTFLRPVLALVGFREGWDPTVIFGAELFAPRVPFDLLPL